MSEKFSQHTSGELLTKDNLLNTYLEDSYLDPKEARELLKHYQKEKRKVIALSEKQLHTLQEQFGNELTQQTVLEYIQQQSQYYLDQKSIDSDMFYMGIQSVQDYTEDTQKIPLDITHLQKPETIEPSDWKDISEVCGFLDPKDISGVSVTIGKASGPVLEIDTAGCNLFVQVEKSGLLLTGQNENGLFVEKVTKEAFGSFVQNYDALEHKRILEELGFTGGLTLGGVLAFSLKTGLGLLLGNIGIGLGILRGYRLFQSYHISQNEAFDVLRTYRDDPESIKNYLFLSQIGYITGYKNGTFMTIEGDQIPVTQLQEKKQNLSSFDISKYQLLRGLAQKGYAPKKQENGGYELDMIGWGDHSTLQFQGEKILFSTDRFQSGRVFEFGDVQSAFLKIQKINDYLKLQMQMQSKAHQSTDIYQFSFDLGNEEKKLQSLEKEIEK